MNGRIVEPETAGCQTSTESQRSALPSTSWTVRISDVRLFVKSGRIGGMVGTRVTTFTRSLGEGTSHLPGELTPRPQTGRLVFIDLERRRVNCDTVVTPGCLYRDQPIYDIL